MDNGYGNAGLRFGELRHARRAWLLAGSLLVLSACASEEQTEEPLGGSGPVATTIDYVTEIDGEVPGDVESYLLAASNTRQGEARPPTSELILRRRAEGDLDRLTTALRAQGYYEGSVRFKIARDDTPTEPEDSPSGDDDDGLGVGELILAPKTRVVFEIAPGPRFLLSDREIEMVGEPGAYEPPPIASVGLKEDEPAIAQKVFDAEQALIEDARRNGFPFAQTGKRQIVVDYDTKTMDVKVVLDTGRPTPFAEPLLNSEDIEGIDRDFLRGRIPYEAGDPFDRRKIERARLALVETELFSTVTADSAPQADENGQLPVRFAFTQRKHRTIGAGVGFRTDDGPNGRLFWEHRNILGAGEQFNAEVFASLAHQEIKGRFRKPDFIWREVDLIAEGNVKNEETDAFDSRSVGAGIGLETQYNKHIRGSLGFAYRYAQITEQNGDEDTIGLISIPAALDFDYSDDLLDPSEGWRLKLTGAPFWDTLGLDTRFLKLRATATAYRRLMNEPRLVAAIKGSVGSISGASRNDIPADERFYAGGGGSVRGIPFQLAGQLDGGEPVGGRSVLETSAELRWRAFDPIELVGFFDAGSVFDSSVPTFDSDLEMGAGIGFRYVTPVGPLRVDIAVPIDRRSGIDDSFQFYISIGQAF